MRRVLRRLSAGLLALVLLITYSVPLVGLAYDEQAAKAAASEDCRTWRQQDTRWKDYMMGTSSGSSVGDVGCLMIAMSMMIKICEVKGDSFQPMDFITYTKQIGGFSSGGGFNNYGNDIVCASVSSIVYTTINGILNINAKAIKVSDNKDLVIQLFDDSEMINKLILNMIELLTDLANQYPKNIKISKGE